MANQYLESQLKSLNLKESFQTAIESAVHKVVDVFLMSLAKSALTLPEKRQRFKAKPAKVEESPTPKPKPDKQHREGYFKEQQKKVEETKEFTKKLEEDRINRQKRVQERERELRNKALQEIEEQKIRQIELEKKLEEDKQRKLAELVQKSEIRKRHIEEVKQETAKRSVSSKPLYMQMEDAYKQQVLMPQLEQHKAELAKKRILYQPLDREEFKDHIKKHEEIRREQEYRRKKEFKQKILEAEVNSASFNLQSKFTLAILEEERNKKDELEKIKEEKQVHINKRLQYARLVKEMFPPVINESKKFIPESELKSKKTHKRAYSNENSRDKSIEKKKISVVDYKSEIGIVPKRQWKKNPLVPEPKQAKEKVIVDYLADKRKERENPPTDVKNLHIELEKELLDENFDKAKAQKIKQKADRVDKVAKQQERLIESLKNDGVKGIEVGDQVNDMIISSIRAKLALLDKFSTK
ncbi:hypothetical protein SteCoe_3997 [Stentor coeruleus]|uniref:Uncharacterized protein n=1 Tax=Stentor coeruleus TaxID=5963 RepID=A0A1R2BY55_9CILI|nr:hypothetical protein SteCoe_17919 [Stentor coeruleus]OMJ93058.1 hypothetical protein SteCoe_3997 [Stentor coeruleus]